MNNGVFKTLTASVYNFLHTVSLKNPYFALQKKNNIFNYLTPEQKLAFRDEYNPYYWNLCGEIFDTKVFYDISDKYKQLRKKYFGNYDPVPLFDSPGAVENLLIFENTPIKITSIEDGDDFDLTKENLKNHPITEDYYRSSISKLKNLFDMHPDQVDLIRSIFFPAPMISEYGNPSGPTYWDSSSYWNNLDIWNNTRNKNWITLNYGASSRSSNVWNSSDTWDNSDVWRNTINTSYTYTKQLRIPSGAFAGVLKAEPFSIVAYYPPTLEPYEETSIVYNLDIFLNNFNVRYNIPEYYLNERLGPTMLWSMVWSVMPLIVFKQRIENINTSAVHIDLLWEYLSSNGLSDYRSLLTRDQSMFLYKNIRYLKNIRGTARAIELMVENLLEPYNVSLYHKRLIKKQHTLLENCKTQSAVVNQQFTATNDFINDVFSTEESIETVYKKEVQDKREPLIGPHLLKFQQDFLPRANSTQLPTKLVELKSKFNETRLGLYFIKFTLESMLYWCNKNVIKYDIPISVKGHTQRTILSFNEALGLLFYSIHRSSSSNIVPTLENKHSILGKTIFYNNEYVTIDEFNFNDYINKSVSIVGPVKIPKIANITRPFKLFDTTLVGNENLIDKSNIKTISNFQKNNVGYKAFLDINGNTAFKVKNKNGDDLLLTTDEYGNVIEYVYDNLTKQLVPYVATNPPYDINNIEKEVYVSIFNDKEYVYQQDDVNYTKPLLVKRDIQGNIPIPFYIDEYNASIYEEYNAGDRVELFMNTSLCVKFVKDTDNNIYLASYNNGTLDMPQFMISDNRISLNRINYYEDILKLDKHRYDSLVKSKLSSILNKNDLLNLLEDLFTIRIKDVIKLEDDCSIINAMSYENLYNQLTVDSSETIHIGPVDSNDKPVFTYFEDWFKTNPNLINMFKVLNIGNNDKDSYTSFGISIFTEIVNIFSSVYLPFSGYSKSDYDLLKKLFVQLSTYYITFLSIDDSNMIEFRKDNIRVLSQCDYYKKFTPKTMYAPRTVLETEIMGGSLISEKNQVSPVVNIDYGSIDNKFPPLFVTSNIAYGILFDMADLRHYGDLVNPYDGFGGNAHLTDKYNTILHCAMDEVLACGFNEIDGCENVNDIIDNTCDYGEAPDNPCITCETGDVACPEEGNCGEFEVDIHCTQCDTCDGATDDVDNCWWSENDIDPCNFEDNISIPQCDSRDTYY